MDLKKLKLEVGLHLELNVYVCAEDDCITKVLKMHPELCENDVKIFANLNTPMFFDKGDVKGFLLTKNRKAKFRAGTLLRINDSIPNPNGFPIEDTTDSEDEHEEEEGEVEHVPKRKRPRKTKPDDYVAPEKTQILTIPNFLPDKNGYAFQYKNQTVHLPQLDLYENREQLDTMGYTVMMLSESERDLIQKEVTIDRLNIFSEKNNFKGAAFVTDRAATSLVSCTIQAPTQTYMPNSMLEPLAAVMRKSFERLLDCRGDTPDNFINLSVVRSATVGTKKKKNVVSSDEDGDGIKTGNEVVDVESEKKEENSNMNGDIEEDTDSLSGDSDVDSLENGKRKRKKTKMEFVPEDKDPSSVAQLATKFHCDFNEPFKDGRRLKKDGAWVMEFQKAHCCILTLHEEMLMSVMPNGWTKREDARVVYMPPYSTFFFHGMQAHAGHTYDGRNRIFECHPEFAEQSCKFAGLGDTNNESAAAQLPFPPTPIYALDHHKYRPHHYRVHCFFTEPGGLPQNRRILTAPIYEIDDDETSQEKIKKFKYEHELK